MTTEDPNNSEWLKSGQFDEESDFLTAQQRLERKQLERQGNTGGRSYSNGDFKHSDDSENSLDRVLGDPKEDLGRD